MASIFSASRCAAHAAVVLVLVAVAGATALAQVLPSWNDGPATARILAFVQAVTDKSSRDSVPLEARIATFDDDGPGKSVGIQTHIGRRPIGAFGNSDGDLRMLQYTAVGSDARLMRIVHHDDAVREFAYDRESPIGRLDKALDAANAQGWTVVSMKNDWRKIFPFD